VLNKLIAEYVGIGKIIFASMHL